MVIDEIFVGSLFSGESVADFDPDHEGHPGWRADEIVTGRTGSGEGKLSDWLIAEEPNIVLVDMQNDAGIDYRRWNMGGDMWDDLHPFETGYAKMADLWFTALMDILAPCPLPLGHIDYCRDCGPVWLAKVIVTMMGNVREI